MDFVKVMREQQRMCQTRGDYCDGCPLQDFHCSPENCHNINELRDYENRVMTWSREHTPEYPTIGELFDSIKSAMGYKDTTPFDTIADEYIPERVAKEFGLVPVSLKYTKGEWTP